MLIQIDENTELEITRELRVAAIKVLHHWWDNVEASSYRWRYYDTSACDFCRLYCYCCHCPIYKDTGRKQCAETPYWDAAYSSPKSNWLEYEYLVNVCLNFGILDLDEHFDNRGLPYTLEDLGWE